MFISIDGQEDNKIQGFQYTNHCDIIEQVTLNSDTVILRDEFGDCLHEFWVEDIPKLINALQAAYNYQTKENK